MIAGHTDVLQRSVHKKQLGMLCFMPPQVVLLRCTISSAIELDELDTDTGEVPRQQTTQHHHTEHSNTQTLKHANTQTRKHANTQTRKHTNTQREHSPELIHTLVGPVLLHHRGGAQRGAPVDRAATSDTTACK